MVQKKQPDPEGTTARREVKEADAWIVFPSAGYTSPTAVLNYSIPCTSKATSAYNAVVYSNFTEDGGTRDLTISFPSNIWVNMVAGIAYKNAYVTEIGTPQTTITEVRRDFNTLKADGDGRGVIDLNTYGPTVTAGFKHLLNTSAATLALAPVVPSAFADTDDIVFFPPAMSGNNLLKDI